MLGKVYDIMDDRGFHNLIYLSNGELKGFEVYNPLLEESVFMVIEESKGEYRIDLLDRKGKEQTIHLHQPTLEEFRLAIDEVHSIKEGVLR